VHGGDPIFQRYANTMIVFQPPGAASFKVDLKEPPEPMLPLRLAEHELSGEFVVITACNPGGQNLTRVENVRRTTDLRARLVETGLYFFPANGTSPDGTHIEPGFAVSLPLPSALTLAAIFGQEALFWWGRGAVLAR
jgi:uncharacterized protein DUF3293